MDLRTRRGFLLASGVVGAGALAAGAGTLKFVELLQKAWEDPAAKDRPADTLVLVTLYGGNDGLNTIIPYADSAYHSLRPELAYDADRVLHVNDVLGLNPVMPKMKQLWDEKRLAVILGVGYPRPDRSHFKSMDIWQTTSPDSPANTGWIGRWLDGIKASAETAVSFEPVIPPLMVGKTRIGACVSYQGLTVPPWISPGMVAALGQNEPDEPALQARAAEAYADLVNMERVVREAEQNQSSQSDEAEPEVLATGTGGGNALAAQLALVARCIEAGVPTRVYSVSLGGFDTHAMEIIGHEMLLRHLDEALGAFVARMRRSDVGQRVTVVVYSEFGRRVRANASEGTDHGTAGPVLVLGSRVAGGFYGEQPSLTDLDDGDLKATVDFRDVFGTVLASVLSADPDRYLGNGYRARLMPLFRPE